MHATIVRVENDKVELHTPRLRLRGATVDDPQYLFNAFSNPEVMLYWSELPHSSDDRTREWISKMIDSENNGLTDFVICLKPNDKPIGKIGAWAGDEIGFLLDRSQWHKGLAKEALSAIVPYLFEERKFESISADVDPRNDASTGILKKAGFEVERFEEKTLEVGGVWVDSVYLRLTKEGWEKHGFQ